MSENGEIETPNSQTEPSTEDISTSQVAQEFLKVIEEYRKSGRKPSDKASTMHDLIASLTASTPELSEPEFNDSLSAYLSMLEQHDCSIRYAGRDQEPENPETEEVTSCRSKRAGSPGSADGVGKRQKQDDTDFLWVICEQLSNIQLKGSLGKTLRLLRIFA